MKAIKDTYYIKIKPEFLFDEYEVFTSAYTPWVYLSLKFKYKYYLEKAPHKTFTVDVKNLADYYVTTPATIYEALNELETAGLLIKKKREYQLVHENIYLTKFQKVDMEEATKYTQFILFYQNAFDDLLSLIKREILPIGKYKRLIIKCLKVYYYLMVSNRHCLLKKEPLLESSLTQTSLERTLGIDHKVLKVLLGVLNDTGYIKVEPGKIFTLNKKIYDPEKHWITKEENDSLMPTNELSPKEIINTNLTDPGDSVPRSFIGYNKILDGKMICVIYYNNKLKKITVGGWCTGDGVSPTSEESTISTDLLVKGKTSKYYDPNIFGKYKPENESYYNTIIAA